jgi:hypothetical protein
MNKLIILAAAIVFVSCNNEDPILKKLEERKDSLRQQGIKDSIHFERVDRLIKAGYTYEEAEAKVTEIENK